VRSTNPRYILDLLARIVTVSLETMTIVEILPALGYPSARGNRLSLPAAAMEPLRYRGLPLRPALVVAGVVLPESKWLSLAGARPSRFVSTVPRREQ
jgi:hypothetical protein